MSMKTHMELVVFAYIVLGSIGAVLCVIRFALMLREQWNQWYGDAARGLLVEQENRGFQILRPRPVKRPLDPIHGEEAIKYGAQIYQNKVTKW